MCRQIIRPIKLRNWFPAHDPLAASVARLSILREDLSLELFCGIKEDSIKELDGNSSGWRRLYFFRRSILTLDEIRRAIETLSPRTEFKDLLSKQGQAGKDEFYKLKRQMEEASSLLKDWRDKLGAHVLNKHVEVALQAMQPDREGFVEVEPTLKVVHYRFAGELVLDVLVPGLPEQNARPKFETEIHKILMLAPVIRLIDNIVGWYGKDRQLL